MPEFKPMDPNVFAAKHALWLQRGPKPRGTWFGRTDGTMTKTQFSSWVQRVRQEEIDRQDSYREHLPPRKEAP